MAAFAQDGDPYRDEMEQCVELIMERLHMRGVRNHYSLAYQSRVGPVRVDVPSALMWLVAVS
jgi:ferrochelatase